MLFQATKMSDEDDPTIPDTPPKKRKLSTLSVSDSSKSKAKKCLGAGHFELDKGTTNKCFSSTITRSRKFQQPWFQESEFKGQLQEVNGEKSKAYCSACSATINLISGKHDLVCHSRTKKHGNAVNAIKQTPSIEALFAATSSSKRSIDDTKKIKEAEIHIASIFAVHPLAFQLIDHILPVFQKHKDVLDKISLGRKKCTNIVKNIIGAVETEKLAAILKVTPFSIFVDESISIQNGKYLCLLVRYFCPNSKRIYVKLLDFILLDSRDCSAEALFSKIENSITGKGLSMKMIIGLGTDNASVMVGGRNSLYTRLVVQNPQIVLMRCHSSHIAAGNAGKALPKKWGYFYVVWLRTLQVVQSDLLYQRSFKSFVEKKKADC